MHIHHLNCGAMCPLGGRLMDGVSVGLTARLACHCLLIETRQDGLVLVDTGFGIEDVRRPGARLPWLFRATLNITLDSELTALRQVQKAGFNPADVRHIVLTHLDFDHAGGLDDFPNARIHVFAAEVQAAQHRDSFVARRRYQPEQWHSAERWKLYRPRGEAWYGFQAVRDLDGLPPDILLVPLIGHTAGHCGVAVQTRSGWLLHAGDAYFYREEMNTAAPHCTPGLAGYQKLMEVDAAARRGNQARLRALKRDHGRDITLTCAHDPVELKALQRAALASRAQPEPPARPRALEMQH